VGAILLFGFHKFWKNQVSGITKVSYYFHCCKGLAVSTVNDAQEKRVLWRKQTLWGQFHGCLSICIRYIICFWQPKNIKKNSTNVDTRMCSFILPRPEFSDKRQGKEEKTQIARYEASLQKYTKYVEKCKKRVTYPKVTFSFRCQLTSLTDKIIFVVF